MLSSGPGIKRTQSFPWKTFYHEKSEAPGMKSRGTPPMKRKERTGETGSQEPREERDWQCQLVQRDRGEEDWERATMIG